MEKNQRLFEVLEKMMRWSRLECNENLTLEFLEHYIDKPWVWGKNGLSKNPIITPEFIEKYIDKLWDWGMLSKNPNITPEFVEKHIDKPWNWGMEALSCNANITPEFIEKHIENPWEWGRWGLSNNSNVTPEFIEKYIDKPWGWGRLFENPNITPEFREKHSDKYCELKMYKEKMEAVYETLKKLDLPKKDIGPGFCNCCYSKEKCDKEHAVDDYDDLVAKLGNIRINGWHFRKCCYSDYISMIDVYHGHGYNSGIIFDMNTKKFALSRGSHTDIAKEYDTFYDAITNLIDSKFDVWGNI